MQPIPKRLGGKDYHIFKEVDPATGTTTAYMEDVLEDPVLGQKTRRYLAKLEQVFDTVECKGRVTAIGTWWGRCVVSNSGLPVPGSQDLMQVRMTKESDIKFFALGMGDAAIMSAFNIEVAEGMGFNHLRPFETNPGPDYGTVKVYPAAWEDAPPTHDYKTWSSGDPLPDVLAEPDGTGTVNP